MEDSCEGSQWCWDSKMLEFLSEAIRVTIPPLDSSRFQCISYLPSQLYDAMVLILVQQFKVIML